jgi:hypothetical protein
MRLSSEVQSSTAWVLGDQEVGFNTNYLVLTQTKTGPHSVDQRGGKGGTTEERGFEQSGSSKHVVSVEANACPAYRLPWKVTGVGDDFDPCL